MEIGGYSILGWLAAGAAFLFAGWMTSYAIIWLLTLGTDWNEREGESRLVRYKWVITLICAVTYFVIVGNIIGWNLT